MNLVCNELKSRGWEVCLVPINKSGPDQVILECAVFPLERQWRGTLQNTIRAFWKFHKTVHLWDPDIIILNCDLPEMFGAFLLSNRTLVAVEHSKIPWIQRAYFGKIIRKILGIRGVTWVSVSSHIDIWPKGTEPRAVLQNPLPAFDNSKHQETIQKVSRLVFVGRFSPEKRPSMALEIGAETGIEVLFIGDGAMRESLEMEASTRNIKSRFLGQVRNPWAEMQEGDLLIVPSTTEGDGLVVLEALRDDKPMLLTDIPDFRRFNLPDINYCPNLSAFVDRIKEFADNLTDLSVPKEISNVILRERELSVVGDSWECFIQIFG